MARNPRAAAQRENAARQREFRAGRGYQSAIPSSFKTRARESYQSHLNAIQSLPASQRTEQDNKQLAQAAALGMHGHAAYAKYDTPENRKLWYHNKK